jgi:hypothetical protein
MAMLPCGAYAGREIEKCAERRDNGYWKWDEWADDWYYKSPSWQPGKFVCYALFWTVKWLSKACYWSAHKVCVSWKFTKILRCVLYVSSNVLSRLFGKILGFGTLAIPSPTSPFPPAIAYGRYINDEGNETERPIMMCWTETADLPVGSSGLRLRFEQLRHYSSPFHTVLPQFTTKAVDGEVSHREPALTFLNNIFFLAWTGKDSEHRLHVMQSSDGGDTWLSKVTLNASSLSGPALAVFNNRIHLAWKSKPRQGSYLNIMSSVDGITWENETRVVGRAESGPALATLGSVLFIAWNGKDDYRVNIMDSRDGLSFENRATLQGTTDAKPALCTYGRHLYLAWKEKGREGLIRLMRSTNGAHWETVSVKLLPDQPLNTGQPALASCTEGLIIGWADPKLHIAGRR